MHKTVLRNIVLFIVMFITICGGICYYAYAGAQPATGSSVEFMGSSAQYVPREYILVFLCVLSLLILGLLTALILWKKVEKRLRQSEARFQKITQNNFIDITERKVMEEELRTSRETLSLAVELARLGPWKFDIESNLFEFSDEFYAIYGTTAAKEGSSMPPEVYKREFVHPEDAWVVDAEVERALRAKTSFSTRSEHRIIRRDGEVRTIAVRINVIRNDKGSIVKWYGANQDVTENKRIEAALLGKSEELRHAAYTDALTGLPNRMHLNERLKEEMVKACRGESAGAVLFIDLDDLKMVNDAFGHTYGDALIIKAGEMIVQSAGPGAFVGRVGGDEFMVVWFGEHQRSRIAERADRIIATLHQDVDVMGMRFHISSSAGAALYPQDGGTAEDIFKSADNAMYAAKSAGKNCWRFYEVSMQKEAYERILLTNSLHGALAKGELLLHYQPQVCLASGSVIGFEALLRWNSREHGGVSPARFIPLAEQSGVIHKIGAWVLREACRFAGRLTDGGWSNIRVAVNVSPYQLATDNFIGYVREAINAAGIEPWQLELEITENALIASLEDGISKLGELRAMGVRLSLDDFGTGYSSLTYLQRLPVETLKIDKSFIDMISVDASHQAIISTIVDIAHIMKMTVVAEGVETAEQMNCVTYSRCDCAQGYLYSPPVPEEEAVRLLTADS